MSEKPNDKPKSYSREAVKAFQVAFSTVLAAFAILEMMGPLEEDMIDFQRISLKLLDELYKDSPDREKIDLLLDALRKINGKNEQGTSLL